MIIIYSFIYLFSQSSERSIREEGEREGKTSKSPRKPPLDNLLHLITDRSADQHVDP